MVKNLLTKPARMSEILFPTRLYKARIPPLRGLEETCLGLAMDDRAGRRWSRDHGYGGYTSYASLNDLPRRATVFGKLKTRLDRHAAAFAEALALDLGAGRLKLDSLWVNILKPGAAHSGHIHPHSVVSGTIYVETPPGSSALKLEDPRLPLMMAAPNRLAEAPEAERPFVYLTPAPGTVLLWESFIRHEDSFYLVLIFKI